MWDAGVFFMVLDCPGKGYCPLWESGVQGVSERDLS